MWYNEAMKKKLIGLLGISVLMAASFLNMPAYAITTSEAQAACSALGGQFNVSNMNSSGEATWSCSAPKTGTVGGSESTDTYKAACETLGGTFTVTANSSEKSWSCSGFNANVYGTSNGYPPSITTTTSVAPSAGGTQTCGGVKTAILKCDGDKKGGAIFEILATALSVFTFGVGAAAVIGVIIAAYQYITARDNSQVVAKAKNRIVQIVIGLVIWVMIWAVLEFLLPGGLFANGQ